MTSERDATMKRKASRFERKSRKTSEGSDEILID